MWRLVLDRAWTDGGTARLAREIALDGRFVLRPGRLVELVEEAG